MQAVLARIDAINPDVNAIVTLARESALREARRATATLRRGAALSPLFGVPVGIKDVTATKGIRTTYGSKLFDAHVPDEDALVVERLRAAGAIVIGKTNTPEFAFGPNTVNAVFGATRNPWNLALTAGGSSGGSEAALATGMCPLAEGTDRGGSLRGAASYCGGAVFERAIVVLRSAGARVDASCPDMSDVPEIVRLTRGLLMVARHAEKLREHRAVLQPGLVENTEQGLALTAVEIARGELLRTRPWQRVREVMTRRDLLIAPTSATPPFLLEQPHVLEINGQPVGKTMQRSYLTYAFSVLGLPAISIPCGFTRQGLPVGMQIIGKRRGEAAVLRAAAAFEAAQPWAVHGPPIVRRRG